MLNQLHATADLAAERRRALRAEADAYRIARTARHGSEGSRRVRRARLRLLRLGRAQPAGRAPA